MAKKSVPGYLGDRLRLVDGRLLPDGIQGLSKTELREDKTMQVAVRFENGLEENDGEKELLKQKFQTREGEKHPAGHFAFTPDLENPSTWKLLIHDARHVAAAVAALGQGFRGEKVDIPEESLLGVKAKVRAAYKKFFPDKVEEDGFPEAIEKARHGFSFNELIEGEAGEFAKKDRAEQTATMLISILRNSILSIIHSSDEDKESAIEGSVSEFSLVLIQELRKVDAL